ncbi:alpha-L-rhamnosidase [Parapedobacter composti]|uniref:alpha-L-rhamnosidase n=1 Tax=Parapedobacter composti TaxID=623281 RepID=A0A1I1GUX1_9SPHI|nr:alpha-L-rhamnosidase [Parapedobacter composti]SFC15285.1 alpha-L-rhamnosidase [Parapedobacter composti]
MKFMMIQWLFGWLLLLGYTLPALGQVKVINLRTELLSNPLGIGTRSPRLSWEINSERRGVEQLAYQLCVASSPEKLAAGDADLWDSGRVDSRQSVHVAYAGAPLVSRQDCFWKVRLWTTQGETGWSEPAHWSMGLLDYVDWRGRWIGLDRAFPWDREDQFSRLSARYFRKEFDARQTIKQAVLYITGLGLYELYLNGERIGDQVLAPVPTDYLKDVKYNTFDVTAHLREGRNAIGVILGNGRYYTMRQAYKPHKIKTFGYPKLRMNLYVTYADGTMETVHSDDSWKVTPDGPIRTNNEYDGEEYDATKELGAWHQPGYDDTDWLPAMLVQEPGGMPTAQMSEHMKVMKTLQPRSVSRLNDSVHILDMGQNMTGWIQLRVKGIRGQRIKLRFAESLQDDGSLYLANLRDAKVTDVYTLKGSGTEIWEPRFVYHGFRFVEVTGYPGVPAADDFVGKVVYDGIATTGSFETSDSTINQVFRNAYWGILGNYKGMPVDCPQRNERQPWLGDRTTGAYGESFVFDNAKLYAKWLDDIQQAQTTDGGIPDVAPAFWRYYGDNVTWPGTYLTIADMLYNQFGDFRSLQKHYPSMKKWMDYMRRKYTQNGIITKDKYGDWCVPPESLELIHSRDSARRTDGQLIATATYYRLLQLMDRFARLTGHDSDTMAYQQYRRELKAAFNSRFFDSAAGSYSNGTVTANLLPLSVGLVPQGREQEVFAHIVRKTLAEYGGHISTGVVGTQWLMRGLSRHGRPDVAFRLATNRTYPSWGYMVENGATTIWELWNGNTANPAMNSQNHVMLLGDLLVWYYEHLAGIKAAEPAFARIVMKPEVIDGLDFVHATHRSLFGTIGSHWKKDNGRFLWEVTVPPNTRAEVHVPAAGPADVLESGQPASGAEGVTYLKTQNGRAIYQVLSGTYRFEGTYRN